MSVSALFWMCIALFGGAFVLFFGRYLRGATGLLAGMLGTRLLGDLFGWQVGDGRMLALALPVGALAAYAAASRHGAHATEVLGAAAGGVGAVLVATLLLGEFGPSDRMLATVVCLIGTIAGVMFIRVLCASGEVIMTSLLGCAAMMAGVALLQPVTAGVAFMFLGILTCLGTGIQSQQLVKEETASLMQPGIERASYAEDTLPYSGEWAGHYDHGGTVAGH